MKSIIIRWLMRNITGNAISKTAEATGKVADSASSIVESTSRKANATKRQESDMLSDNRLSKLIRPLIMIWSMILFTAAFVLDCFGHPVEGEFMNTIFVILAGAVGFYFPGRSLEKYFKTAMVRHKTK